jgi:hypothetical protein
MISIASAKRARFGGVDVVGHVFVGRAAKEAGDNPAAGHRVEHRQFLSDADGIEDRDRRPENRDLGPAHDLR